MKYLILILPLAFFSCDKNIGKVEEKLNRVEQCVTDFKDLGDVFKEWVCPDLESCYKMMKKKNPFGKVGSFK